MSGPAERSLKLLRDEGYMAAVVEKWNPHARIRQDLFQIIDVVAVKPGETVGVQSTSYSNVSSRVRKIEEAEATPRLRDAGWRLIVHGWHKVGNRWKCRVVDLS